MKNTTKIIGKRLFKERKKQGMTQERLSELADIDRSALSMLENGKHSPSLESVTKIAHALNYPIEELFKGLK